MRPDSLDTLLYRAEFDTTELRPINYELKLNKPIPIFIEYVTVTRRDKDKLALYIDVYGRDEEYLKLMRGE